MRRRGRRLELTWVGQGQLDDGDALWRAVARGLVGGSGFDAAVTELALLAVVSGSEDGDEDRLELLQSALAEEGWRERGSGRPPSAPAPPWPP